MRYRRRTAPFLLYRRCKGEDLSECERRPSLGVGHSLDKWPYNIHKGLANEPQVLDHGEPKLLGVILDDAVQLAFFAASSFPFPVTYCLHSLQDTAGHANLGRRLFDLASQIYDEPYFSAVGEAGRSQMADQQEAQGTRTRHLLP